MCVAVRVVVCVRARAPRTAHVHARVLTRSHTRPHARTDAGEWLLVTSSSATSDTGGRLHKISASTGGLLWTYNATDEGVRARGSVTRCSCRHRR